jgi:hypothetical protein
MVGYQQAHDAIPSGLIVNPVPGESCAVSIAVKNPDELPALRALLDELEIAFKEELRPESAPATRVMAEDLTGDAVKKLQEIGIVRDS